MLFRPILSARFSTLADVKPQDAFKLPFQEVSPKHVTVD